MIGFIQNRVELKSVNEEYSQHWVLKPWKAAALGLATATPLTDPRQYINSNLRCRNLKI